MPNERVGLPEGDFCPCPAAGDEVSVSVWPSVPAMRLLRYRPAAGCGIRFSSAQASDRYRSGGVRGVEDRAAAFCRFEETEKS
jgi:hypothetical protein